MVSLKGFSWVHSHIPCLSHQQMVGSDLLGFVNVELTSNLREDPVRFDAKTNRPVLAKRSHDSALPREHCHDLEAMELDPEGTQAGPKWSFLYKWVSFFRGPPQMTGFPFSFLFVNHTHWVLSKSFSSKRCLLGSMFICVILLGGQGGVNPD